jgi:hypothetical protein
MAEKDPAPLRFRVKDLPPGLIFADKTVTGGSSVSGVRNNEREFMRISRGIIWQEILHAYQDLRRCIRNQRFRFLLIPLVIFASGGLSGCREKYVHPGKAGNPP